MARIGYCCAINPSRARPRTKGAKGRRRREEEREREEGGSEGEKIRPLELGKEGRVGGTKEGGSAVDDVHRDFHI